MSSPVARIADAVRERLRVQGSDPAGDPDLVQRLVRDEVRRYSERALGGTQPMLADKADTIRQVIAALTGFGALQPLLDDPSVEEIWLNAPDRIFAARGGVSERLPLELTDQQSY